MNTELLSILPYSFQQELLILAVMAGESVLGTTEFLPVSLAEKCDLPESLVEHYMDGLRSEGFICRVKGIYYPTAKLHDSNLYELYELHSLLHPEQTDTDSHPHFSAEGLREVGLLSFLFSDQEGEEIGNLEIDTNRTICFTRSAEAAETK